MEKDTEKSRVLVRELGQENLLNVIEPILKTGARAHLHVELGGENGDFYFDEGRMVFARASAIVNEEAAYYLLSWRNGTFALRKVKELPPERNVDIEWLDFMRFYEEELDKLVLGMVPRMEGGLYLVLSDPRGKKVFSIDHLKPRLPEGKTKELLSDPRIEKSFAALMNSGDTFVKMESGEHYLVLHYLPQLRYFSIGVIGRAAKDQGYEKWMEEEFEPRALEAVSLALELADKKRVRGRILVIDDSPTTRAILEDTLTEYRFRVTSAENGYEGLIIAQDEEPDMIFLDVMMPKLSGYDVLRRLRANEKFKDLPVVMLTSKGLSDDKGEAFKEGANLYIEKPFTSKKILAIVENVLGLE